MDEGDRSGGDEPDRETGSADSDTGNDGPDGGDPTAGDDRDGDRFAGNGFAGDDPIDASATDGDESSENGENDGSEMGSERDVGSGGGSERASKDRSETDRSGVGTGGDRTETERSGAETGRSSDASDGGLLYRFRHDREGPLMWVREMLSSVAIVLVIGLILFGVSGVWPPMVAVESGSMEPNMEVGDLVFVTEPGRLAPDAADNDIGVVTHEGGEAADYRTFGSYGSVVIYRPPGRTASPIIHRAMFRVEEGENWYDRADDRYHSAADCGELNHCPAPHDGFITLGDNNGEYDQANGLAAPVRADWVTGVARVRVPYLGYVRLIATGQAEPADVVATSVAIRAEGVGINGASDGSVSDAKPIVSDANPIISSGDAEPVAVG
ncbi:S24/S26 family peptidase [Halorubrum amylolyticum]|uniref:S26 family signal peptidase n=1 Tax=Halorubrum amylolyticum TaxID=2508724 RepID=UPI0010093A40|nr:S26 family signal peptidase [Halorubrum amylolyticum]